MRRIVTQGAIGALAPPFEEESRLNVIEPSLTVGLVLYSATVPSIFCALISSG